MKRIITITILCLGAIAMFAQPALKVADTGNVGLNNGTPTERLHMTQSTQVPGFLIERTDGTNTINFVKGGAGSSGSAFFYAQDNFFTIVPAATTGFKGDGTSAAKSFTVSGVNGNVGIGTWTPNAAAKLDVRGGQIFHEGTSIHSDKRLKNNIVDFEAGIKEVMKLNTIEYEYNGKGGTTKGSKHIGIVAQDLQKLVPSLVDEVEYVNIDFNEGLLSSKKEKSKDSYLTIKDNEIKYLLMNAIKDQQYVIEEQEARITKLESAIENLLANNISEDGNKREVILEGNDNAQLLQNKPNPFVASTQIDYVIPKNAQSASIEIYSQSGQLVKNISIDHTGQGSLEVSAENIPTGVYTYNLVVDGQRKTAHKMIKQN